MGAAEDDGAGRLRLRSRGCGLVRISGTLSLSELVRRLSPSSSEWAGLEYSGGGGMWAPWSPSPTMPRGVLSPVSLSPAAAGAAVPVPLASPISSVGTRWARDMSGGAPHRPRARGRREDAVVSGPGAAMLRLEHVLRLSRVRVYGLAVAASSRWRAAGKAVFPARLEEDASLLRSVWRRRRQRSRHRGQAPLLDVGLDEHKAGLAEVDVHDGGAVGADGGEEVVRLQAVDHVLELLAVACEEDGACPGAVANADDVALDVLRAVGGRGERLVEPAEACRQVGDRVLVEA